MKSLEKILENRCIRNHKTMLQAHEAEIGLPDCGICKVIVESIKTSAKRTAIMVQHIDKMLDVYRIYCSKLSEKDKRRYKIIKALYISKTPMTIAEISKKFSVSKVTVYEDIKIAKERLSSLFFGIDGLKFF